MNVLRVALLAAALVVAGCGGGGDGGERPLEGTAAANRLFRGIDQHGGVLGRRDAPVTLLEYADLQCSFCAAYAERTLPTIVRDYVQAGKVRLELRLVATVGPDSRKARRIAAAAQAHNRLWNFAQIFYANQGEENAGYVTDAFLRMAAESAGLNGDEALKTRGPAGTGRRFRSLPTFYLGKTGHRLQRLRASPIDPAAFARELDKLK